MTTRGSILDDAFEPLGLADWVFTLTPDEQAKAFRALDRMMSTAPWEGVVDYVPGDASPNRGDDIGDLEDVAEAIAANLSLRLAPGFGKTVSGEQRRIARAGLNRVTAATLVIPQDQRAASQIAGAGNRWYGEVV